MSVTLSTLMLKVDAAAGQKTIKEFGDAAEKAGDEGTRMGKAYADASKNFEAAANKIAAAYKTQIESARETAEGHLKELKAMQESEKQRNKAVASLEALAKKQQDVVATLSKSTAASDDVEKAEAKLVATKEKLAQAMADQKTAQDATKEAGDKYSSSLSALAKEEASLSNEMRETVELFNQGRQAIADSQTPLEAYNQRIAELESLSKAGAIGQHELASETARAKDAMEAAERSTDSLANSSKKLFAALGIGAAAFKAYQFAARGAATAQTNMMASAKLEGVLRATGGAAGFTRQQLLELSEEMQRTTTYSSTMVDSAHAMMLTFTSIADDTFPRAMKAAADMGGMLGGLESAAHMLGKSLNNPADGLMHLSRQGIRFTEGQKVMISSMVETGNVAGAQAIILAELESRFNGVSKAIADTPAGKLQALRNEYSDLTAVIGDKFIPTLVEGQKILNTFTRFLGENIEVAATIAAGAMTLMIPPALAMTKTFVAKTVAIKAMTAAMAINPLFSGAVVVATIAAAVAMNKYKKSIEEVSDATESNRGAISRQAQDMARLQSVAERVAKIEEERIKRNTPQHVQDLAASEREHAEMMEEARRVLADNREEWNRLKDAIVGYQNALKIAGYGDEEKKGIAAQLADAKLRQRELVKLAIEANENMKAVEVSRVAESRDINSRAYASERESRRNVLDQMRLDLMDSSEREYEILRRTYEERKKLFRAGTEERAQLDTWYDAQHKAIEDNIATEEKAKYEERLAAAAGFTDRLLTDRERVESAHAKSIAAIIAAEKEYGLAAEQVAALKIMADREMEDSIRSLTKAQEQARNKILGLEEEHSRLMTAKTAAGLAARRQLIIDEHEERLKDLRFAAAQDESIREESAAAALRIEEQKLQALRSFDEQADAHRDEQRSRLLDDLLTEEQAISVSYERRLAQAQAARDSDLISEREYQQLRLKYQQDAQKLRYAAEASHYRAMSGLFGGLTDLMGAAYGEQFGLTKAFAIATAKANVAAAVASAAATQPFIPAGLAAVGSALSATAGIVNTIKSATFAGNRDRGGTIGAHEWARVAENRPEYVNGRLIAEPTDIRGPARITSGAETERILSAMRNKKDAVTQEVIQEGDINMQFYDRQGNFTEEFRSAYHSGELRSVLREALQGERAL